MSDKKLSDLPTGLTEVYLDSISDSGNLIKKFALAPGFEHLAMPGTDQSDKEWCQILDLSNGSQLVCVIKANALEMRLVHLSEGPLSDFRENLERLGQDPGKLLGNPFISSSSSTEQDIVAEISKTFKQFEKAQIVFDAPIVPNLCLKMNQGPAGTAVVNKLNMHSASDMRLTLMLATQSNHIFEVKFEPYFLQKGRTVFVEKSDSAIFEHLGHQKIRCFERVEDLTTNRELMAIGSTVFIKPQSQLPAGQNRQQVVNEAIAQSTLTFLDLNDRSVFALNLQGATGVANRATGEVGGTGGDNGLRTSWFSRLTENLKGLNIRGQQQADPVQATNHTASVTQKFATLQSEALMAPESNVKNLEGVVSLKKLSNNLLAVVYTNGLFRVIQLANLSVLVESNLLGDRGALGDTVGKVVDAKIAFECHRSVADACRKSYSKGISFGVILTNEAVATCSKRNILQTFNLRFNDVRINSNQSEDLMQLGDDCELIHTRQQVFPPRMVITSLSPNGNSAFLYTTLDPATRETSIFSTSSAQPIWDRGSMELKHQIADKVPFSVGLQNSSPQLEAALKKHYFDRITVPDRFAPETIYTLLFEEGLFDRSQTIKQNLQRAIRQATVSNIQRFLRNLITIEEKNSKILAISTPLRSRPTWRTLVRPLGICVLTDASYISSVEASINLGSVEKESYWAMSDTRLLIDYLSVLKTTVSDSLFLLHQGIQEQPQQLRMMATQCLRSAKNQQAVLRLARMMNEGASEIQQKLSWFQDKILTEMVLSHANKGTEVKASHSNVKMGDDEDSIQYASLNNDGLKVLEQSIRHEIDALLQMLIDVYLGQLLLQRSTQQSGSEEKLARTEDWICQIIALQKAFNSDFTTSGNKVQIDQLQTDTVLAQLLGASRDRPEIKGAFDIDATIEASEVLTKMIGIYTQKDDLMETSPTFVPLVARQLIELGQYQTALTYLKTVRTESLGVSFARFFSMACLGDELEDKQGLMDAVARFTNSTLALDEKPASKINLNQVFMTTKTTTQAQKSLLGRVVSQVCRGEDTTDPRLQYLLVCAGELASSAAIEKGGEFSERCAALFISRCLQLQSPTAIKSSTMLPAWSVEEQDYLLSCLHDSQRSVKSTDMIYLAVSNMKDLKLRQCYLLKFFELTRSAQRDSNVRNAALTSSYFSQSDITLTIEALQDKISHMLNENTSRVQISQKWREQICSLVKIYHDVAQAYSWQDQFVRFAWDSWESRIKALLTSVSTQSKKGQLEQVLTFAGQLMTLAFSASKSCGKDFYFHSTVAVKESQGALTSNKRTYQEAIGGRSSDQASANSVRSSDASKRDSSAFWTEIDKIKKEQSQFSKGKLIRIDSTTILGVLLQCRARLICHSEGIWTGACCSDSLYLSKVLVEIDQTDLAVELAIANGVSPAFAIVTRLEQLKNLDIRDGEDEEEERMRQEKINNIINLYLDKIKPEDLGQLAQFMIQLRISFSTEMRLKLITTKQVSFIVGCYLCPEISDVVRAVEFLVSAAECNTAIKLLISADLNQVVSLLQKAKDASDHFGKRRVELSGELQTVQSMLEGGRRDSQLRGLFRADSGGVSGLASIQAAVGQNTVIEAILAEEGVRSEDKYDTTKELKKNLKKCEASIATLKTGAKRVETELKKIMNAQ